MKKIIPFTNDIKFNNKIYEITSISLEHNLCIESNNVITGEFIVSGDYKMNDSSINTEPFIHGLPFDITLDTKYDMDRIKIDIDDFKFEIINEEILRVNIDVMIEGVPIIDLDEEEIKPSVIIDARNKEQIKDELKEIGFEGDKDYEISNEEIINIITENKSDEKQIQESRENIENLFKEDKEEIKQVINEKEYKKEEIQMKKEEIKDIENNCIKPVDLLFNNIEESKENYVTYHVHIVRENDNIDSICLKYGVTEQDIKEYNNIEQITLGSKIVVPSISNETI